MADRLRELTARTRATGPGSTPGRRVALAALRSRLDAASADSRWSMDPDGVLGRALLVNAGSPVTFPLAMSGPVQFSARAMLYPHDWRDGRDGVHASVGVTNGAGGHRVLWRGALRASDLSSPRGRRVQCTLPADSTALTLTVTPLRTPRVRSVTRAIWVDPELIDPGGAPAGPTAPAAREPAAHVPQPPAPDGPLISVLTPVHNPPREMLEDAIASVRQQTFTDWELCLVDDGSSDPEILALLRRHADADPRIRVTRHDTPGGISAATNAALEMATGRYIALLDHDDILAPDALAAVAERIADEPDLDMVYSDEDIVADGRQLERHPKPGWSPEHLAALMYTCHLGVYRRALATELGGFQSRYDGCQDYDFVLRLTERTDRVAHIPRILYHWRAHIDSTAGGEAKPYAYVAQPGAIADHLERLGVSADVQFAGLPGIHRIVHRVDPELTIDIVLALTELDGLREAAASWTSQAHQLFRVVLAAPASLIGDAARVLADAGIGTSNTTVVDCDTGSHPTEMLGRAAAVARAEHLLLAQAPPIGLTHDWLTRLLGYSAQPGVGAAGPIVLSADGRIAEAGIALPEGIPLHLHHGSPGTAGQPVVYNVSAVSGALLTPRATFERLGGLEPQMRGLALIDYCLRAAVDAGERTVIVPDSRVRTAGRDKTVNDLPAIWQLQQAWARHFTHDPYYNANYRTDRGDATMPRAS